MVRSNPIPLSRIVGTISIIVGAVFGSVTALAVAEILVWWNCRKKKRLKVRLIYNYALK